MTTTTTTTTVLALASLACMCLACAPEPEPGPDPAPADPGPADPDAGAVPEPGPSCAYPLGQPRDPSTLPPCCEGRAHCVPADSASASFTASSNVCEGGQGLCVPDEFIEAGGLLDTRPCTAGTFGAGVCLSTCVKQVAQYESFLHRDVCAEGELCAPCTAVGMDTHACDLGQCE